MMRLIIYIGWVFIYTALFGGSGALIGAALGWLAQSIGIANTTNLTTVWLGTGTGLIAGAAVGFVTGVTRDNQHIRTAALIVTMLIGAALFLFSGQSLADDSPWLIGLATVVGASAAMLIVSRQSLTAVRYSLISIGICVLVGALVGIILGWGKYTDSDSFLASAWTGITMGIIPGTILGLALAGTRDNQRFRSVLLALIAVVAFLSSIYIVYSRLGQSRDVISFFGVPWPSEIFLLVLPISIYWAAIVALIYVAVQVYRSRAE